MTITSAVITSNESERIAPIKRLILLTDEQQRLLTEFTAYYFRSSLQGPLRNYTLRVVDKVIGGEDQVEPNFIHLRQGVSV